ncbi:hypothetical protein HGRIS_014463 [Hohenbuehelia grisea]|uniref:Uncharacterized protein n=1 Tax=Hohenbuehelia grisea TaxID=104357 RepID=A0ABR3JUI1_9AGAR
MDGNPMQDSDYCKELIDGMRNAPKTTDLGNGKTGYSKYGEALAVTGPDETADDVAKSMLPTVDVKPNDAGLTSNNDGSVTGGELPKDKTEDEKTSAALDSAMSDDWRSKLPQGESTDPKDAMQWNQSGLVSGGQIATDFNGGTKEIPRLNADDSIPKTENVADAGSNNQPEDSIPTDQTASNP